MKRAILIAAMIAAFVGLASAQTPTTMQNAAVATGNGTAMPIRTSGFPGGAVIALTITNTATVTWEVTLDNTSWFAVSAHNKSNPAAADATTATATGMYELSLPGAEQFRARISAYTSGTVTAIGRPATGVISYHGSSGGGGGITNSAPANALGKSDGTNIVDSTGTVIISGLTTNGFVKTGGGIGSLSIDTTAYVPQTTTVAGHALSSNVTVSASDVGLSNVTNDAQTKASVFPNTAPAAGQLPFGNAGGTAYGPVTVSGNGATITASSAGVISISNIADGSLASTFVKPARLINTTSPITGGGDLSADRTIACSTCLVSGGALGTPSSGTATNLTGLPEGGLSLTDITTANVSTTAHGFAPKLDNVVTHFLNGQGGWTTPAGSGVTSVTASDTTITVAPNAGAVLLNLNLANPNTFTGAQGVSLSSAAAFFVGPNGNTNPVVRIITNVASQADGISISGGAAGAGTTIAALSSGSNSPITLTTKGTGQILLPNTGTKTLPIIEFVNGGVHPGIWYDGGNTALAIALNGNNAFSFFASTLRTGATNTIGWTGTANEAIAGLDAAFSRISTGLIGVGTGAQGSFAGNLKLSNLISTGVVNLAVYVVSGLPSASTAGQGAQAYVTDSTTTAITGLGLAVTGGGSNKVVVVSDGTNWIVQ